MTAETVDNITKTFTFSYPTCTNENVFFNLEVPIDIPYDGSTGELVQRVINMFRIPVYLEEELNDKIAEFVSKETTNYYNNRDELLLKQLQNGETDVEGLVKSWEKLFKDNIVEYADQKGTSDEEVFAAAYHKLVHSPAVETILQVENSYANTVAETLQSRDEDIRKLTQRQTEEMEEKVRLLESFSTEVEINELAAIHFEEQSLVAGRWGSQLDALWQTQRSEFRSWIMKTLEEYQSSSELNTPSNSPLATFSGAVGGALTGSMSEPVKRRLEDSFTIHLGSQLKQTHNVRILAANVLDLCRHHDDKATEASRRVQTALSLYSHELSGIVLLTTWPPSDVIRSLTAITAASTEHHTTHIQTQLDICKELLVQPLERRNKLAEQNSEKPSKMDKKQRFRGGMRTGDVLITKHSNLPDTHVIFHMLAEDDDLKSGDINSRHPAILGLRNILKMACSNDVTSISLPVLLKHEMSDEMTTSWCIRRAELVLKCVKGFMLETASWGGAELKNIQFIVPEGISEDVFGTLAALLPAVFRVSTPLKIKAST